MSALARRRWWIMALVLAALLASPAPGSRPRLVVDNSVSDDFEALALETWGQFLAVFEARSDCFGDVRLEAAYTLDSRAGYDPGSATVTVRVPRTAAMLQGALVHEWAHHVEYQCAEHAELRTAFLAALGLPPDAPWRPGDTSSSAWADSPAEQYAEATIVLVLGTRQVPTQARVTQDMVRVIEEWVTGD